MKKIFTLFFMTILCSILWFGSDYMNNYEQHFNVIEEKYFIKTILEKHKSSLLKSEKYTLMKPSTEYYPFALAKVKYLKSDGQTEEGQILWGLNNGEMIFDTSTWEMSKGFLDCLEVSVNANELNIINKLITHGNENNMINIQQFKNSCNNLEALNSCIEKKIIQIHNDLYTLHINKPKFPSVPFTQIRESLVTKSLKNPKFIKKKFHLDDIQILLQNLFGKNLTVHAIQSVYLPVHAINVKNPDSSIRTYRWNGINGKIFSAQ